MLLTQSSTPIIGQIAWVLGKLIDLIFEGLCAIGLPNIGIAIILFTILTKLLMLPLTVKQQKFTKLNSIMQPEISKIQKKYRGKTDQDSMMKQNQEMQAVYAKYGTSPTGGCGQLLIQMPILFALYQVIYRIPAYITRVKDAYLSIVEPIMNTPGYIDKLSKIATDNKLLVQNVTSQKDGIYTMVADPTKEQIIDFLYKFKVETWDSLTTAFSGSNEVVTAVTEHSQSIIKMNEFVPGINLADAPGFHLSIALLIPIAAAFFQWLSMKLMNTSQNVDADNPAAGMTKTMTRMMPLMSLYMGIILPAGLGIYWAASAAVQIVFQKIVDLYIGRIDEEELVAKSRAKAEKKKKKGKQSFYEKMMNAQQNTTGADGTSANTKISDMASMSTRQVNGNSTSNAPKRGSIAEKANIMKEYNNRK